MLLGRQYAPLLFGISVCLLLPDVLLAHGMSEVEKQAIIDGGNWQYLWLGATHMLSGYDHLAFVFGVIFFLTSFRDIAKYVTAFTLGHSVTLIYATFNAIQLNYFAIDAVIALSVCYIAFVNLNVFQKYFNIQPPNMLVMITSLGLIHGFGLSTRLQALPLSEEHLLANIIYFNVGVELGQISALALMLVVISVWRNRDSFKPFSVIANYFLVLSGAFLFLMQMHGYEHQINADELGGNAQSAVITEMASAEETLTPNVKARVPDTPEQIVININPRGEIEYKLYLKKGQRLAYSWQTDGTVLYYDFHGEPEGDQTGAFQSYQTNSASESAGEFIAPFTGTHGWYWNNSFRSPVIVTLSVAGEYQRLDLDAPIESSPNTESQVIVPKTTHESIF